MTMANTGPIGLAMSLVINGLGAWLALWAIGCLYLAARRRRTALGTYQWGMRALPAGIFYGCYSALLASTSKMLPTGAPLRHALVVIRLEKRLGVWWEPALSHVHVPGAWGWYMSMHLLVTLGLLVWVGTSRPDIWAWARNALAITTGTSLLVWTFFPVDPPRLLPATMGVAQHGLGGLDTVGVAYAALPSLHTAWAAWVAVVIWRVLRARRSRWLGPVYAGITAGVVLVTGNHYVTDVVAGEGLALVAGVISTILVSHPWPGLRLVRRAVTGLAPLRPSQQEALHV